MNNPVQLIRNLNTATPRTREERDRIKASKLTQKKIG
jgi:hypothetical protein